MMVRSSRLLCSCWNRADAEPGQERGSSGMPEVRATEEGSQRGQRGFSEAPYGRSRLTSAISGHQS